MTNILPEVVIPTHLELIEPKVSNSSNGVLLHTLRSDSASVIRLTLVFRGGSSVQRVPYAAASTLSMLSEGTRDFTAQQIAEQLDFYGMFFDNSTDRDYCYLTIATMSRCIDQALELLESMVLRPLFLDSELELYRAKKRQQIIIDRAKPSYIAREAFVTDLFGESHPYGRFASHEMYDSLTPDHLREYYDENLTAQKCFAVASGDITDSARSKIVAFLEKLPSSSIESRPIDFSLCPRTEKYHHIERKEAVQSCIRMGRLLFTKEHKDFIPIQLLAMVVGGYFGSRLVQNLRERNGYTYGAYSAIVTLSNSGYFAIATDVDIEHRDDAIKEINYELSRLQSELIPEEELQGAISTITGELMRLIDGPFGVADVAIENIQSGFSYNYLNDFLKTVSSITPLELREIAREYLSPDDMHCVVVG